MRRLSCLTALCLVVLAPGVQAKNELKAAPTKILLGVDVLERENFAPLVGKRVGLIANRTSRDGSGRSTAEVLAEAPGVRLVKVLSMEHGFFINTEAAQISSSTLSLDGKAIPIVSLYRGGVSGMRPAPQDLEGLDVLVFDVQDVGVRFYTYLTSMAMAMEAAKTAGIEFMVLDRPNPITGTIVQGPVLHDLSLRQATSTAYFAEPLRHGMTAGEVARFYNAELKDPNLVVVPMSGWRRAMWYDQTGLTWMPPSPNLPDLDSAILYPGIGIFEASNLSVGRGTPKPFQWIGAPGFDADGVLHILNAAHLAGVRFSREDQTPRIDVDAGKLCQGIKITITNRDELDPLAIFAHLAAALMAVEPDKMYWDWKGLYQMVATPALEPLLKAHANAQAIGQILEPNEDEFKKLRKPFLLY